MSTNLHLANMINSLKSKFKFTNTVFIYDMVKINFISIEQLITELKLAIPNLECFNLEEKYSLFEIKYNIEILNPDKKYLLLTKEKDNNLNLDILANLRLTSEFYIHDDWFLRLDELGLLKTLDNFYTLDKYRSFGLKQNASLDKILTLGNSLNLNQDYSFLYGFFKVKDIALDNLLISLIERIYKDADSTFKDFNKNNIIKLLKEYCLEQVFIDYIKENFDDSILENSLTEKDLILLIAKIFINSFIVEIDSLNFFQDFIFEEVSIRITCFNFVSKLKELKPNIYKSLESVIYDQYIKKYIDENFTKNILNIIKSNTFISSSKDIVDLFLMETLKPYTILTANESVLEALQAKIFSFNGNKLDILDLESIFNLLKASQQIINLLEKYKYTNFKEMKSLYKAYILNIYKVDYYYRKFNSIYHSSLEGELFISKKDRFLKLKSKIDSNYTTFLNLINEAWSSNFEAERNQILINGTRGIVNINNFNEMVNPAYISSKDLSNSIVIISNALSYERAFDLSLEIKKIDKAILPADSVLSKFDLSDFQLKEGSSSLDINDSLINKIQSNPKDNSILEDLLKASRLNYLKQQIISFDPKSIDKALNQIKILLNYIVKNQNLSKKYTLTIIGVNTDFNIKSRLNIKNSKIPTLQASTIPVIKLSYKSFETLKPLTLEFSSIKKIIRNYEIDCSLKIRNLFPEVQRNYYTVAESDLEKFLRYRSFVDIKVKVYAASKSDKNDIITSPVYLEFKDDFIADNIILKAIKLYIIKDLFNSKKDYKIYIEDLKGKGIETLKKAGAKPDLVIDPF